MLLDLYALGVQKSILTETVFIKTEMNNKGNINFLQNSLLGIQVNFPLVKMHLKLVFYIKYEAALLYFFLISSTSLIFEINFSL